MVFTISKHYAESSFWLKYNLRDDLKTLCWQFVSLTKKVRGIDIWALKFPNFMLTTTRSNFSYWSALTYVNSWKIGRYVREKLSLIGKVIYFPAINIIESIDKSDSLVSQKKLVFFQKARKNWRSRNSPKLWPVLNSASLKPMKRLFCWLDWWVVFF